MQSDSQVPEALDVHTVVAMMVDQMAEIAWQKLGLRPDMVTGKIEKDLEQSRIAIDVVTSLCKFLDGKLDEEDQRSIQNLQRDLKVNFVQKSAEAGL